MNRQMRQMSRSSIQPGPFSTETHSFVAALTMVLMASTGCVSGSVPGSQQSTSSPTAFAKPISGADNCPSDQAQDLTLSGSLTGHIGCSIAPVACHRIHGPGSPGVQMLIFAE